MTKLRCMLCCLMICTITIDARTVNDIYKRISAQVSLKVPGNQSRNYSLAFQGAVDDKGIYLLESEEKIPLIITERIERDNVKCVMVVSITALEDVYFNYQQQLKTGFRHNDCMFYLPGFWYSRNLRSPKGAPSFHISESWLEFLPEIFSNFNLNSRVGKDASVPTSVFLFSEENRLIKIVNNVRIMRVVQRIVNELETKSVYYQYLVVMYYAELLVLIYRYMDEAYLPICTNDSLRKAIAYIRLNYHSDININKVAEEVGISERYLRNLFSQYLNLSPLDYLNQIRINKAVELLRNTEMSIKEVCFQCGFQSPQYFSRIFKQQMGVSPRDVAK